MLWAHDPSEPIGKWVSLSEDRVGLRVEGKLALKTQRGSDAYELLKMDALGLSIGYRVASGGATYSQEQARAQGSRAVRDQRSRDAGEYPSAGHLR